MPKQWFIVLAVVLGAIFLLVTASLVLGAVSVCRDGGADDTVTVYGQGRVAVEPDIATVTLGYENSGGSPELAQQDNARAMARIVAALRERGVAESDIVETQFGVYQEYYYDDMPGAQRYRVSRIFAVTVRDIGKTGDVIATACGAGANTAYGVTYDVSDRQEVYAQALELARGRADEKAVALAQSMGGSLAGVVAVCENGAADGNEYWDYGYAGASLSDYAADASASGGLEITAAVTVTYRIK